MLKYAHAHVPTSSPLASPLKDQQSKITFTNVSFNSQPSCLTRCQTTELTKRKSQISISTKYEDYEASPCDSPSSMNSTSSAYSSLPENEDSSLDEKQSRGRCESLERHTHATKINLEEAVVKPSEQIIVNHPTSFRRRLPSTERILEMNGILKKNEHNVRELTSMFENPKPPQQIKDCNKLSTRFNCNQVKVSPIVKNLDHLKTKTLSDMKDVDVKNRKVVEFADLDKSDRINISIPDELMYENLEQFKKTTQLERSISRSLRNRNGNNFKRGAMSRSFHWKLPIKSKSKDDDAVEKSSGRRTNKITISFGSFCSKEPAATSSPKKLIKSNSISRTKQFLRSSFRKSSKPKKAEALPSGSELLIVGVDDLLKSKDSNNNKNGKSEAIQHFAGIMEANGRQSRQKAYEMRDYSDKNAVRVRHPRHKSASPSRSKTKRILPTGSPVHKRACSLVSSYPDDDKCQVRVWVKCLLQDMEYKTVTVTPSTTAGELVTALLSKFRMKHRDPSLYYLALEVVMGRSDGAASSTTLSLSDSLRPAPLLECQPSASSRLTLMMRRGGLLRVYDEELSRGSYYKSLLVSDRSDCSRVISLVLGCNNMGEENPGDYLLVQVITATGSEVALQPTDKPLLIVHSWPSGDYAKLYIRLCKLQIKLNDNNAKKDVQSNYETISNVHSNHVVKSVPDVVKNERFFNSIPNDENREKPKNSSSEEEKCIRNKYNTTISTNLLYHTYTNLDFLERQGLANCVSEGFCHSEDCVDGGRREGAAPPYPPVRAPKIPHRRQGVQSMTPDLLSTREIVDNSDQEKELRPQNNRRTVPSYNDYENYFYI